MTLKIFIRWVILTILVLAATAYYRFNIGAIPETWLVLIQPIIYLSIFPIAYLSHSAKAMEEERSPLKWTQIESPVDNMFSIQTSRGVEYYKFNPIQSYSAGFYRWRVYTIRNETFRVFYDKFLNKYYHVG